ncbi:BTB/POZ domain-containing protein 19-like isoform X1 [Carcharodon carcharias]|uniref:BTB/POZ domain-containing protein 19-like isoform X1 n=1 Tax=Carcharodon carcharias TaxID=13397 RepID=UPI001B7F1FD0|nr:BTB/POZ domain-containing protein 19-like isoform X1 [Carcharodon carcharias]
MADPFQPAYLRGNLGSFAADMRKMINAPEWSDVKFIVGEERKVVYAHRCILAYRCEAFNAMFTKQHLSSDAKEAEIPFVLSDVQPAVFLAVVEFLYTNCVMLSSKIALDVLTSAVEYGLDELQRLCVDYINSTLTVESACEALQAAVTYRQTDMKDKCLAFIEGHTKSIVKTRGFHELSDPALLAILQSDFLTIDEPDLINFVREWAHVNSVVLDKPVPEIAKEVVHELRLFLLTPEELTILEAENKKDNLIPMDKIAEVWKFHALKKPSGITPHLLRRRKGTRPRDHHKCLNLYHK